MSTISKRKTVTQTPEHKTKNARRGTVSKDADQEVSLMAGGPVSSLQFSTASLSTAPGSKVSREEEVKWLTTLNRRLELALLTRSTQEQAVVTQLMDNQTEEHSFKQELQTISRTYGTVLSQQQNQIKTLSDFNSAQSRNISELEIANNTLSNQVQKLKDDLSALKKEHVIVKKQNDELTDEVSIVTESKDVLNEELERLVEENNKLVEQYLSDSNGKRSKKDDQTAQITALHVKVSLFEKQQGLTRKAHDEEVAQLQAQLKNKMAEFHNEQERMEQDFAARLNEEIEQLEDAHQEELRQLSNQLQDQQGVANNRLKTQLDNAKDQVLGLQEVKTVLERQIADLRSEVISHEAENESLVSQVQKLEEEYTQTLETYQTDIQNLEQHVDDITDLFQQKEAQVDDLMNIKVSLQIEIDHYRKLLDAEEKRLGLQAARNSIMPTTPGARRSARNKAAQRDDHEDEVRALPSTTPSTKKRQDKLSSLVQTGIDLDGKYVKFHNGSTSPISLEGYSIRSDLTDNAYDFDARTLLPNEQIIIFFKAPTKQDKSTHRTVNHFINIADEAVFDNDNLNDKKGQLFDSFGRSVARFEFLNKSRNKNRQ